MQEISENFSPPASTDVAHAVLWSGIIGAARHLAKRQPQPLKKRSMVVQLKLSTAQMPVYFIGAGMRQIHIAPLISSDHSVFAIEIPWPSEWHDAAIQGDVEASPTLKRNGGPVRVGVTRSCWLNSQCDYRLLLPGLIGFEAAHGIQELGGKVEVVMLLDTPAQYPSAHCIAWQKLQEVWRRPSRSISDRQSLKSLTSRAVTSWSILRWTLHETKRVVKERILLALGSRGRLTTNSIRWVDRCAGD